MAALITELIDKYDNVELIRDKIAEILVVESAAQQVLATAASKDPDLWALRVFLERTNPWAEFQVGGSEEAEPAFEVPIVNVSFETAAGDMSKSNIVERQKLDGTFNIDCYGYGVAQATDDGHAAGDERAAVEALRAARLVRNILMAGHYTYLGFPRGETQFVWRRWMQSATVLQPSFDGRTVQQVVACRLAFHVEFNEFSPQVVGEALEAALVTVKRKETGEIYLLAQYELEQDS